LREENAQILDLLAELQAEDSEQSDFDADDDYADGMIASGSGGDGGDDDDLEETFSFDGLLPPDETPRGPAKAERRRPEWKIQDKTTQLVGEQLPVHDRLPKIKVPASASSKNGSRVGSAAISPINVTSQTIMGFESSLALPPILTPALTHQQPAVVLPMDLVSAEGDLIKLVKLGQLFPNVRYNDIGLCIFINKLQLE
jgi:hypothetical protein